ncbi:MAG: hypothetical protein ACJ0BK_06280 [Coraliomargaritaceae bacterium]
MPIQDNSLFRRLHQHAQKRLFFDPGVSRSKQLPAYKRYVELENVMLERMHRKGDSGLEVCQARAAMIDVVIENLFSSCSRSLHDRTRNLALQNGHSGDRWLREAGAEPA